MKPEVFRGSLGLVDGLSQEGTWPNMVSDLLNGLLQLYKPARRGVVWVWVGREWGRYKEGAVSSSCKLQGKFLPPCTAVAVILSSQKQPSLWPFPLNLPIPFPDLYLLGERLRIIKELHNFPPFLLSLKLYWFTDHKTPTTQKVESARSQLWEGESTWKPAGESRSKSRRPVWGSRLKSRKQA